LYLLRLCYFNTFFFCNQTNATYCAAEEPFYAKIIISQKLNKKNNLSTNSFLKIGFLKKIALDSLFPIFCLSCQKEGAWLCTSCLAQTEFLDFQTCPACEKIITDKGFLCSACQEKRASYLDGLIAAVSYDEPAVRKLLHNFKYRFISDISSLLAKLIARALTRNDLPLPDFLVAVPLHPRRLRWRGFNQSFLLASHVSEELAPLMGLKNLNILQREKYNRPQMQIKNYQERLKNMQDIFALSPQASPDLIKNKNILLIDDIATTGATLEQCAKVLKSAGAKKVFAAVVARQSTQNNHE
jgi:ComF family protein